MKLCETDVIASPFRQRRRQVERHVDIKCSFVCLLQSAACCRVSHSAAASRHKHRHLVATEPHVRRRRRQRRDVTAFAQIAAARKPRRRWCAPCLETNRERTKLVLICLVPFVLPNIFVFMYIPYTLMNMLLKGY